MTSTSLLVALLVSVAAISLATATYLAVRPRPTTRRGGLSPVAWHLVRAGAAAALASAAATCVLGVVALSTA